MSVDRFKRRVVEGDSLQINGKNYMQTPAPVVSFPLVRIFLYLALTEICACPKLILRLPFQWRSGEKHMVHVSYRTS